MGKYDSVFNVEETSTESLSPEEGVAAIAIITVLCDSEKFDFDVDTDYLIDLLWETELFDDYSDDEIAEMIDRLLDIAEVEGSGALFNAAYECLPDELLPDAFAAGAMMLIDESGVIPPGQKIFLKELQDALELEDEETQNIIDEVMATFDESAENEDEVVEKLDAEEESSQELYESPEGNFTVLVPVDPEKGGRINEQEGMVGFSDDFGQLLRIDYYPLSPEEADKLESVGQENYLSAFLLDNYVDEAILAHIPDSKVEHKEYLEDTLEGAYFVVVDMPQGSTISRQSNNEIFVRLDALRGLIVLSVDDYLYVVSCQRTFFEGETPAPMEQEVEGLKKQLLEFLDTMEFT